MSRCPICNAIPQWTCKCPRAESFCENGHYWHTCIVHNKIVLSPVDHRRSVNECTCEED